MPRNITITFEDGSNHVYQNAPDDVTPEAVQARAEKEFSKPVKGIDGGKSVMPAVPVVPPGGIPGFDEGLQGLGNIAAGAVRGAGSIGATLVSPYDIAKDAIAGKGLSLASNRERRQGMDDALQTVGAQPNSLLYKGGKLGGEIAGTAGTGTVLAKGAQALGAAPEVISAIQTAGMTTGNNPVGFGAKAADMALRTGAGALTGGATAGLVNPSDAPMGVVIGGATPGVVSAAGKAGEMIGKVIRGPAQTPDALAAIQKARVAGLTIPPTQAKPTLVNRTLEGMAGKISTAQNASAANSPILNSMAARELGLPANTAITPEILDDLRREAGTAYAAIKSTGTITPTAAYGNALEKIAEPYRRASEGFPLADQSPVIKLVDSLMSPAFDASSAVAKISTLRDAADTAFRQGDKSLGRSIKAASTALEDAVEQHLQDIGKPELLQAFKDGRQLIAKTYTVEKALNPSTGTIDAKKLGDMLKRNKPLSGELRDAGEFANRFPKAAQTPERMGSLPQVSPLDFHAAGATSMALGNPSYLSMLLGRPVARKIALSDMVQNRLAASPQAQGSIAQAIEQLGLTQGAYRAAPLLAVKQ
jgi:hypothetical protein